MVDREKWDGLLNELVEISDNHTLEKLKEDTLAKREYVHNFDVKVMFVGRFSAGKTALINRLIDRDALLKEDTLPQTAIATEIKYADEDNLKIVYCNGKTENTGIETTEFNGEVDHIEYGLNTHTLKELSDFTIVDTPGFDSGIERHNNALKGYIGFGSCYVLVISIESGTVDKSTIKFLSEIEGYSEKRVVLLNKTDKIAPDDVERIREHMKDMFESYDIECDVVCVSKFDKDVVKKITEEILQFDAQSAFDTKARETIRLHISEMIYILTNQQKYLKKISTFDKDREIKKLNDEKQRLINSIDEKEAELTENLPNVINDIMQEAKIVLHACTDKVVGALQAGGNGEAVQAIVIEELRPLLIDYVREYTCDELDAVVNVLRSNTLQDVETSGFTDMIREAAELAKDMIYQGSYVTVPEDSPEEGNNDNRKKEMFEVGAGVFSALTDIMPPWVEALVILAPTIIDLVAGPIEERRAIEKKYEKVIIPQIIHNLHDPLEKAVNRTNKSMIQALREQVDEKSGHLAEAIEKLEKEKLASVEKQEQYKIILSTDLKQLEKRLEEVSE